jgi:hypothetical protein
MVEQIFQLLVVQLLFGSGFRNRRLSGECGVAKPLRAKGGARVISPSLVRRVAGQGPRGNDVLLLLNISSGPSSFL